MRSREKREAARLGRPSPSQRFAPGPLYLRFVLLVVERADGMAIPSARGGCETVGPQVRKPRGSVGPHPPSSASPNGCTGSIPNLQGGDKGDGSVRECRRRRCRQGSLGGLRFSGRDPPVGGERWR